MVEGARLEIAYRATYRGFESHSLRQPQPMLELTDDDRQERSRVVRAVLDAVRENLTIHLPAWDRSEPREPSHFALQNVGIEANAFGANVGEYRYQFEGEDDLLHLFVARIDGGPADANLAREIGGWVLAGVPPALVWYKPARHTHHFYVGHDDLLGCLQPGA